MARIAGKILPRSCLLSPGPVSSDTRFLLLPHWSARGTTDGALSRDALIRREPADRARHSGHRLPTSNRSAMELQSRRRPADPIESECRKTGTGRMATVRVPAAKIEPEPLVSARVKVRPSKGDGVEFAVHEDGTITVRGYVSIPTDRAWFFTPQWLAVTPF
jgi:hypothetical protein